MDVINRSFHTMFADKVWIHNYITQVLWENDKSQHPIYNLEHQISHEASAFYPSQFEKTVILTMDGVGEWASLIAMHVYG